MSPSTEAALSRWWNTLKTARRAAALASVGLPVSWADFDYWSLPGPVAAALQYSKER